MRWLPLRAGRIFGSVVARAGCPVLTVPAPPPARHGLRRVTAGDVAAAGPAGWTAGQRRIRPRAVAAATAAVRESTPNLV